MESQEQEVKDAMRLRHVSDYGEFVEPEGYGFKAHPFCDATGGMILKDEDGIVAGVFKDILIKVAKTLAQGKIADLTHHSAPSWSHCKVTYMGLKMSDLQNVRYIKQAAQVENDPVKRLKLVITGLFSTLYIPFTLTQARIPMIAIVGETLQRELETGERLYVEQTIYKPSTNRYLLEDPDGLYRMYGFTQIKSGVNGPNSVAGWNIGTNTIEFKNGQKITYTLPRLIISGMLHGIRSQAFYNHSIFTDEANGLVCDLEYNPWDDNSYTSSFKK